MFPSPRILGLAMLVIVLVGALCAYLVVVWVSLAYFVVRDARRRSPSGMFLLLAGVLGFFPPLFGAIVYFMVRPPRTIEEERTLALEEQALLEPFSAGPEARPCPSCGREIEETFVLCPYCRTQFARRCATCDRMLRLGWSVCPYCATDVGVHALNRPSRSAS